MVAKPPRKLFSSWYLVLGIISSTLFLYLAFRNVHWDTFFDTLKQVNVVWLFLGIGLNNLVYFLIAVRWWVLLSATQNISIRDVYDFTMIGYLAGLILPARLGDVGKSVLLGRYIQGSPARVLGSVVLERFFDVLILLAVGISLTLVIPIPDAVRTAISSLAMVALVSMVGLLILVNYNEKLLVIFDKLTGWLPKALAATVHNLFTKTVDGLSSIRNRRQLILALAISVLIWALAVIMNLLYMQAFGISVPAVAVMLLNLVLNLGIIIPSSPGGIGVYQYLVQFTLSLWGIESGNSLGFAIVTNLLTIILVAILGNWSLSRKNLSLNLIRAPKNDQQNWSVK